MSRQLGTPKPIPWAAPHFWGKEENYLLEALASSWISNGPFVERLEREFQRVTRVNHALAVSNGTTALHLAFIGIDLKPNDEVIVPGFCFQAAANVAIRMGAVPVFAEVDPDTWCVTAETLERCRTERTRAAVAVHTYGNVSPMKEITAWGEANGVVVLEDAAEAFGSEYEGQAAGTMGAIGTYSFHATKTISTGEGGMVVTNSDEHRRKMALYRSHGMGARKYWHEVAGHNFRLTNLQAALGCAQLEHIADIRRARTAMHDHYKLRLQGVSGLKLQTFPDNVRPLLWALGVKLDEEAFPQGRDELLDQLAEAGIESRPGFYAASQQPVYHTPRLPVCEALAKQIISIPFYPGLPFDVIDRICSTLIDLRH